MSITLYGIPGCDTMKKARRWLDDHDVEYAFHDYKKHGIDAETLQAWCGQVGWETLVNRRGTTWRKLPEADRDGLDEASAIGLMQANTSLIKRPVLLRDSGQILVGFDEGAYSELT